MTQLARRSVGVLALAFMSIAAPAAASDASSPGPVSRKSPELSTILPAVPLTADQAHALEVKTAAAHVATTRVSGAAPGPVAKPADVHTALAGSAPGERVTIEALRLAKEAAATPLISATPSRHASTADVLGPIPRPEWLHAVVDRQRIAAGLSPEHSAAGARAPSVSPGTAPGTRGTKQPELLRVETGAPNPSPAELAKRARERAAGGSR